MSRVHPPGRPTGLPFRTPFGNENACNVGGQVFAVAGMKLSIVNHVFGNPLGPVHEPMEMSARFTSFCKRHENGVPAWLTCVVRAVSAEASPFTPSQP